MIGRPYRVSKLFARQVARMVIVPYLILTCVLAVCAMYLTISVVVGALEEQFRADLLAAGVSANKAMARLEASNLAILRQMTAIADLDVVIAAHDVEALQALLAPLALHTGVPYVDVFMADGAPLLALRAPELGPDAARRIDLNAPEWEPVQRVLRGEADDLGDRHAGVVFAPWGPLVVSAAPVKRDGVLVGAIAVALPLDTVVTRLSDDTGSRGVALYRLDGDLITTTLPGEPRALERVLDVPLHLAAMMRARELVVFRHLDVEGSPYLETVGLLAVRAQPSLLLGISTPSGIIEQRAAQTRQWMVLIFGVAILVVVTMGILIARQITRPVKVLIEP
jgi:hypothetical protein